MIIFKSRTKTQILHAVYTPSLTALRLNRTTCAGSNLLTRSTGLRSASSEPSDRMSSLARRTARRAPPLLNHPPSARSPECTSNTASIPSFPPLPLHGCCRQKRTISARQLAFEESIVVWLPVPTPVHQYACATEGGPGMLRAVHVYLYSHDI